MSTPWPALPYEAWRDTLETLHLWTQIVGKVQLALTPATNHFWNVAFRVTSRGLASQPMPFGWDTVEATFDFSLHELVLHTSRNESRWVPLVQRPVAEFYRDVMEALAELGVPVRIREEPVEIPGDTIPFSQDLVHHSYDPLAAWHCWRVLHSTAIVMEEFRARFTGKASPVHFFWGSFDLAASRFSGHPAPVSPEADVIMREGYCEEVSSVGFWPGDARLPMPAFYAYHAPAPQGFSEATVLPGAATWDPRLGEFILPYDAVRASSTPRSMLLDFFQSTYEAGANLAGWDRARLERAVPLQRAEPTQPKERGAPHEGAHPSPSH